MTATASYGGYSMPENVAAHRFGIGEPFYQPYASENSAHPLHKGSRLDYGTYPKAESVASVAPVSEEQKSTQFEFGLPPSVKNAVRMIKPFYSEGATVEKARSFWDAFERATVGLADAVRLSAFQILLKGKTGDNWWMYSRIDDFETLRTRFYHTVICQPPLQMIERLNNAKRSKGMSAEVMGDAISILCDAAQVVDPQMRYQYFLAGLRNKGWKAALQTTMVNDIPRAVTTLLYKNMHLPAEDETEFEGEVIRSLPRKKV
ncbi:hypothetical protein PHMEG_00017199 [Phytophthora megakarya]|uniref:Uncharacterized protein n=1 Tax=Phytophthora megakarya TaxID=4795 RepID=A0A225VXC9_9STRA|nr:hypothetical protein PHMEG_00017199 [Phytophthora megakarya]